MRIKTYHTFFYCIAILSLPTGCFSALSGKADQLPYYTTADFTPHWLDGNEVDTIHRIPAFSFIDQQGDTVTEKTFDNKITVVNFFFTSCPGICKKLTQNLAAVQAAFENDADVLLLSHSVMPGHDSVSVLHAYAQANGIVAGKWHLVTGDKNRIYKIARSAYFADEDMGMQQDSTSFLHTENILLVDKQHHIRGVYKGTLPSEIGNLITDIKKLEDQE